MRVLSIDGGGVRGVVPSAVLAYTENEQKVESPDRFDFFAGTSTGAIVAGSLAMGLPARRVLQIFQDRAPVIFSREGLKLSERALSFKGWALPAYSHDALREALTAEFGDATLTDCPRPIAIPSLDVVAGAVRVFRGGPIAREEDRAIRVVDAIIASTSAPTFFPSAQVGDSTFVDGALWANNPALIALLDARDFAGSVGFDGVSMLSLGCGRPHWGRPSGFGERRGLVGWGAPLMSLMMAAQSQGVDQCAARLLGPGQYLRIDPSIDARLAGLDDHDNIPELLVLAATEARANLDAIAALLHIR